MNIQSYFNQNINPAVLPENLRKAHEFIVDATHSGKTLSAYQHDDEIRETINLSMQSIEQYLKQNHIENKTPTTAKPAAKKQATKGKAPLAPTPKKPRTPRKVKKAATPRPKAKPRKTTRAAKPKPKTVTEKAPVRVKKLSLELQLIKSFLAMNGKSRKVITVRNFLSKIEQANRNTNVPSQKSILTLVAKRMKEGLAKLDKQVDILQNIQIEQDLLKRCKEAIKNAKPRLEVQYLSGLKGKK